MLILNNIHVELKNFKIEDISFEVQDEEIVVLLGENGSGKTTLLNSIAGFVKLSSGSIIVEGIDIQTNHRMKEILVTFSRPCTLPTYDS